MIDGAQGWLFIRVVVSTAVVIGSFLGLASYLRCRLPSTSNDENQEGLRLLDSLSVGPNERIVIVRLAGQDYLLGVTPGRMTLLERMTSPQPNEGPSVEPSDCRFPDEERGGVE